MERQIHFGNIQGHVQGVGVLIFVRVNNKTRHYSLGTTQYEQFLDKYY